MIIDPMKTWIDMITRLDKRFKLSSILRYDKERFKNSFYTKPDEPEIFEDIFLIKIKQSLNQFDRS